MILADEKFEVLTLLRSHRHAAVEGSNGGVVAQLSACALVLAAGMMASHVPLLPHVAGRWLIA